MRDIVLNPEKPVSLTLAADPRLSATDYINDQIWEFTLNGGEPQALAVQTTYGLRATKMRLFPRFTFGKTVRTNPAKFSKPPVLKQVCPNFLRISFAPHDALSVAGEYWITNSHAIAGRFRITNTSSQNQQFTFQLVVLLQPAEGGTRAIPGEINGVPVISGSTENLSPVVFITGGASTTSSPYPALIHDLELAPGSTQTLTWCHAALNNSDASFDLAREITGCSWDAEIARIELQNSNQLEIYTGMEEWDQNFFFSFKSACGLLLGGTTHLDRTSYVTTRLPDDGYSHLGDGSDYGPEWSGQTPLDTYFLSNLLLPSAPGLMEEIYLNHLDSLNQAGEIDWKPGLGGQRSNHLATPLLAAIAWKIYQISERKEFLAGIFPRLIEFIYSWFSTQHDSDQDGIPEWDHMLQAGLEDHPIFTRWDPDSHGVDITTTESPVLCAFLYNECQTIIRISKLLNKDEHIKFLESKADALRRAVEDAWNDNISSYTYWDKDSHLSPKKVILGQLTGPGLITLDQKFPEPQRLVFQIQTSHETTRKTQIIIRGLNTSGKHRIEMISAENLLWFPNLGTATSEQLYQSIESIEIKGLDPDDLITISSAGLQIQDIASLLPIWAGIPSGKIARCMVEETITNPDRFWREFGLPACAHDDDCNHLKSGENVYLPWCLFIGEGLLSYGYRSEAAELVTRIMRAINESVEFAGSFRRVYNAETGQGAGDADALWGLAPLGLFLETLGVQIISPWKIRLSGINPYPWPVTIKFRGMTVLRGHEKTQIIFPDGQTVLNSDPEPCLVSLE